MSHMNSSKVESAHLEIVNKFSSENSCDSPQDASNGEHLRLEGSDAESHAKFKSKAPVPLDSNTSQTQSTFLQSFESFVSDAQPQDDITDRKEKYEATLSPHREASLSSSTSNSKRKLRNKGLECVVASVRSGASSICDSVGVRTRKASRNPIIITLSSDSEPSEPKPKHDSDEDIKPFVDAGNGKRKRLAHIKAEYVRKFTEIRRKRNIKQTNYKDDDSSSSASEPIKSKKNKPKRPQKHLSIAVNDKRYFGRSVVRNKKCFKLRNRVQKTFSQQRHFNPSSHSPIIGALRSKRTRIVSRNHVSNIASIISTRNRLCQREPGSPTQVGGNVSRSPKCRFSQKKSTRPVGPVGRPRKNPLNRKDNDAPSNTPEVSKIQLSRKDKSTPSKSPGIAKMQSAQKDKDTPPNTPVISKMQSSEKVSESAVVTADFPNNQPTHKNIVPYNNNVSQENQTKDSAVTFNTESKKNCSGNKKCSKKRLFNNVPRSQIVILKKRGRPRLNESKNLVKASTKLVINKKIKPFLQNAPCFDISPKLPKCSECRIVASNKSRKMQNSYCRFLEYRKLSAAKNGTIMNAGFSEPSDATEEHLKLWLPRPDHPPEDLNVDTSKLLLEHVGDQFCDLIEQEKEALSLHIGKDKTITWKRIVQGVREMCDVCDTTLFNIHWVCPKCGLAICIDCYKVRKQGILVEDEENQLKGRDEYQWLLCAGRQPHEQEKLIMAQIVPGTALWTMKETMHKIRELWKIPAYCKCSPEEENSVTGKYISTGISKQLMSGISKSFASETTSHFFAKPKESSHWKNSVSNFEELDVEINDNALKWLTNDVSGTRSSQTEDSTQTKTDSNKEESQIERTTQVSHVNFEDFSSIRNLLLHESAEQRISPSPKEYLPYPFDELISYVIESKLENSPSKFENNEEKKITQRYPQQNNGREPMPIRIFTMTESYTAYSQVPHSWLCNGRLLLLHQPHHHNNLILFQEQWKRGQPIMVKGINDGLNMSLWHPDGFCQDFGEIKNDLVNCKTGAILTNLPMRKFWEGFENFSKRMKDEFGEYMLLKLKDWPPGEDFSEKLPGRFQDLMNGLPLPEYTHRNGILNLAGRLPAWFVRPDLGPKMYNAYGSALYPSKGTTNLHLDVSDAVNVMVYVGIPHDGNDEDHINEALNAIDEGGCDSLMRERVRSRGVRPGALWHIYNARDADKIREMLNKVAIERGEKLEAHHDPIHDQSWYIDAELRKRLYQEFNVEGYAIAQCLGDAVFIPAGAPHQVRNLHSCVKVAEDFVSPENIAHCFKLTQEFRHLSDTHTNHEDKLQIKNIIYHVVRDSLSHLIDKSPNN